MCRREMEEHSPNPAECGLVGINFLAIRLACYIDTGRRQIQPEDFAVGYHLSEFPDCPPATTANVEYAGVVGHANLPQAPIGQACVTDIHCTCHTPAEPASGSSHLREEPARGKDRHTDPNDA